MWQLVVMRMGRQGRGFVSASVMQWNRYLPSLHPQGTALFSWPASGERKTAMLTFTPRLQYYSSQPLNEKERGGERDGRGAEVEGV